MTYDFSKLIGSVKLSEGAHENAEQGMCAMEFVSWLEGEPFSDKPQCTCPVIAAFVRSVNDKMHQYGRDQLLPYLPRIVGTRSPEHEKERAEYFAWQAIRVFAPNALIAIGLHDHAKRLIASGTLEEGRATATAAANAAYAANATATAANAAANAAYAANATATAANAAAAYAANAAAYAANADIFATLSGVLKIGPKSPGFTKPINSVVEQAKIICPV